MDARTLVDEIEGLFSLPEVCQQFNRLLDDKSSDVELAEFIGYDSVLTARLFNLANDNRLYSRPAESISEAILRVGTDRLRRLMASTTATNVFANMESDIVAMDNYWHHSVCCALACESLAAI